MTPAPTPGETIRAALTDARLTQAEVARRAGLTEMALSRRITGRTPWRVGELATVARILNLKPSELLEEGGAA